MARAVKPKPAKAIEQTLWEAADKLCGNQEPTEYKHVLLGLVFLKYISDRFEKRRTTLESELAADGIKTERLPDFLEDRDGYTTSHNSVLGAGVGALGLREDEIAQKLVKAVRESVTIDWNLKDSVRATMRSKVRRLLARYDYPPDAEAKAIELVLEQAELFAKGEVD